MLVCGSVPYLACFVNYLPEEPDDVSLEQGGVLGQFKQRFSVIARVYQRGYGLYFTEPCVLARVWVTAKMPFKLAGFFCWKDLVEFRPFPGFVAHYRDKQQQLVAV